MPMLFGAPGVTQTTFSVQVQQGDGTWQWYSQGEYEDEQSARELAGRIYGGAVTTGIIRIERIVAE